MSAKRNAYIGAPAIAVQVYTQPGSGLLITATGNITFITAGGDTVTWTSIPVGKYDGLTVKEITAATATGYVLR